MVTPLTGLTKVTCACGSSPWVRAASESTRASDFRALAVGCWSTRVPSRATPRLPELKPAVWKAVTALPLASNPGMPSSPDQRPS